MFKSISVKYKILLSGFFPLFLALVIGAIAILSFWQMQATQKWVDHTHNVLRKANSIVMAAVNMETGMRGYLLAGREEFLEPLVAGQESFDALVVELSETVSDNPAQVARLDEARAKIDEWRTKVVDPRIELRREIGDAPTMNDMAQKVAKGEGKAFFDQFRQQIADFAAKEVALLETRGDELESILLSGDVQVGAIRNNLKWVEHTYKVIIEAERILLAAVDMETGMRGYLLAGRREFLEPFDAGVAAFESRIKGLQKNVSDNPPQVALLQEALDTITDWRTDVVVPMKELRAQIGYAPTMDNMADIVAAAEGKVFFDAFRSIMVEFSQIEEDLMQVRIAENEATQKWALTFIAVAMGVALIVGSTLTFYIGRDTGSAISRLTKTMRALADGKNSVEIPYFSRKDEIGGMALATDVFKQNALRIEELNVQIEDERRAQKDRLVGSFGAALRALAEGRLNTRLDNSLGEDYKGMVDDFNNAMESLSTLVSEVVKSSESVTLNIKTISDSSLSISRQTEVAAAAVQETNMALTDIVGSVKATAGNAATADKLAQMVRGNAEKADTVVGDTVETVNKVEEISSKISEISSIIGDIAFQTNLLALNAAVEAARAGSAGTGFSVVASEVRSLSLRTADAAKEINELITTSNQEIASSVQLVERTSSALHTIVGEIDQLSENVADIAQAAEAQSTGLNNVAQSMKNVETNAQRNAADIEETAAASGMLNDEAELLREHVSQFDHDEVETNETVQDAA
ncbi:MAG: methyl-accepting chemotaxis protein [Marinovum sp.]|nr:methyl-accepting chemotaxis protein [Marinovum sp.]